MKRQVGIPRESKSEDTHKLRSVDEGVRDKSEYQEKARDEGRSLPVKRRGRTSQDTTRMREN